MNPQDEQNNLNSTPQQTPSSPIQQPAAGQQEAPKKRRTGLALLLLIGPSALLIFAIILGAVSNFIFSSTSPTGDALYADNNPVRTIINVFIFLAGAVTVITWLPGIVIGIILLAKK
jgi:hypothetical protein